MPSIYLSPSVQEYNKYVIGGDEEYYMNLIADAMVPYLRAGDIDFTRNSPGFTLDKIVEQSNLGNYDLHLALHSNFSPSNLTGILQGPDVYYYAYNSPAKRAAEIISNNLKSIYPNPELVTVIPNTTLGEIKRVKAPAVLVETAYHDNYDDATWLKDNINGIAKNLVYSLTEYFEIPFADPYETISY
ncbi:N-acetylmuramoyl-L-alanine amidase family protein [Anaerovorax odorimutans]|uniref:N-acetylmuramoyl-L-alanine amidase family protein n=1 Tax=Anaerovorax odorimutans TaxID=109327 RepID=UPI00041D05D7|nr:N-acetylmuramoyl-L-alanine amidase [Anaerovorax odorimutans]